MIIELGEKFEIEWSRKYGKDDLLRGTITPYTTAMVKKCVRQVD